MNYVNGEKGSSSKDWTVKDNKIIPVGKLTMKEQMPSLKDYLETNFNGGNN